ncbi:MAG: carboxymuconolactone decarboxylase family protein [Gammaproteobacteria bacterium]|nr:MAG: carboxymuconolactone decarboxylase family protein [Gammaproteobacteria bacterium]
MNDYQLYDENTAPAEAQQTLVQVKGSYGFIPNLYAIMAESPSLVKAYATISQIFEETSFSDTEKQLILLAISHENTCDYCMAAHSTVAQIKKVPLEIIEALRDGRPLPDKKLEALRQFVRTVVVNRGHATEVEVKAFLDAGYTRAQLLDVLVGVGMKTLSNYTNHIADTPLDTAFQPQAWKKAS